LISTHVVDGFHPTKKNKLPFFSFHPMDGHKCSVCARVFLCKLEDNQCLACHYRKQEEEGVADKTKHVVCFFDQRKRFWHEALVPRPVLEEPVEEEAPKEVEEAPVVPVESQ
jgi:hypothetical protein